MDIKPAMQLAGRHLIGMLAPQWGYFPHFRMIVNPDHAAQLKLFKPHHNVGRWPDAMLRLEAATGFEIPGHIDAAALDTLRHCFDNPDHLLFDPLDVDYIQPQVSLHSCREGLLALLAHVKYRNNRWARGKAHQMLETIRRVARDDGTWDFDRIEYEKHCSIRRTLHPTFTSGRLIEALVWYYRQTGDDLAIELADRFARYHLEHHVPQDGELDLDRVGNGPDDVPPHTHSYLGTLRGLVLFGELTNQQQYIDAVKRCFDRTVMTRMIKPSGWTDHNIYNPVSTANSSKAEVASCGDVAQLAMWLARNGSPGLLDITERLVRCRLLPSQVTERVDLTPASDEDKDEYRDLSDRFVGALGGVHYHVPHGGKQATTDVTCAALHSLCDVYNHIVVKTPTDLVVQFHFDFEDRDVKVTSKRDRHAELTVQSKSDRNLRIRVPRWTPADSVAFTTGGKPITPTMLDNFAFIPRPQIDTELVLTCDLPESTTSEETDGVTYTCLWRGDEITGISPNTDFLPFYPFELRTF